jgi:4-amino-4-deoxy-L-arabinose transferase-like glycosyltransferase
MGWLSAGLMAVGVPWDWAFRVPSLIAAYGIAALIAYYGWRAFGTVGMVVGLAAFGLNLLSPRLATLVRTDMLLSAMIFVPGWLIAVKLRSQSPWTASERWLFGAAMTGALLTKGPVIYAFLVPGLVLFALLAPDRKIRRLLWSGWLSWLLPLALFLIWGVAGLLADQAFYQDVVQREFLSRFKEGGRDDERPQPFWFYFPHLIHKFAPWSILLPLLFVWSKPLRNALRTQPALFWCLLWAIGGLLVMTLVPAKRVDRIFPVVPPLCLLLVEVVALTWKQRRVRVATGAALLGAATFAGGYFIGLVPLSYSENSDALVRFTREVDLLRDQTPALPLRVVRARDEGLLIYLQTRRFTSTSDFKKAWSSGQPGWYLLSGRVAEDQKALLGQAEPEVVSELLKRKNEERYLLFRRDSESRE